jgi:hypothetical protein
MSKPSEEPPIATTAVGHAFLAAEFYKELLRLKVPEDVARDLAIAYTSVLVTTNVIQ